MYKTFFKVLVNGSIFYESDSDSVANYMASLYREEGHSVRVESYRKKVK
jgi:hypothetical protein